MIKYNKANNPSKIVIPVSSPEEVLRYQQGIAGVLATIELRSITPALKEDIKVVYNLLDHMQCKDNLKQLLEAANIGAEKIERFRKIRNRGER
ncbi:hypothetical protein KK083_25565 [Fulvivirgaceae bacterium PWU4]|uniref:Uncharacterized protein n=1 Tax=Chryseosolibacter histidini TaxID=2782349 RepID=A0AAP2GLD8_9BACT|nr:hypothetical protein [Chryseosolibacter histidini]MBT1700281.1 hypothetical protein [Chryseosolibacter histidini]